MSNIGQILNKCWNFSCSIVSCQMTLSCVYSCLQWVQLMSNIGQILDKFWNVSKISAIRWDRKLVLAQTYISYEIPFPAKKEIWRFYFIPWPLCSYSLISCWGYKLIPFPANSCQISVVNWAVSKWGISCWQLFQMSTANSSLFNMPSSSRHPSCLCGEFNIYIRYNIVLRLEKVISFCDWAKIRFLSNDLGLVDE